MCGGERAENCKASVNGGMNDFHLEYKKGIRILGNHRGRSRATRTSKSLSGEKGPLEAEAQTGRRWPDAGQGLRPQSSLM